MQLYSPFVMFFILMLLHSRKSQPEKVCIFDTDFSLMYRKPGCLWDAARDLVRQIGSRVGQISRNPSVLSQRLTIKVQRRNATFVMVMRCVVDSVRGNGFLQKLHCCARETGQRKRRART